MLNGIGWGSNVESFDPMNAMYHEYRVFGKINLGFPTVVDRSNINCIGYVKLKSRW
jgi:hypothetical protein